MSKLHGVSSLSRGGKGDIALEGFPFGPHMLTSIKEHSRKRKEKVYTV